jgi:hypothetical protein
VLTEVRRVADVRYREIILPDFPKHLVTIKFILGTPALPEKPISSEAVARTKLMGKVNQEMAEHGDMVMLPVSYSCLSGGEPFSWRPSRREIYRVSSLRSR